MTVKCSFCPYLLTLALLLPAGALPAEVVKKVAPAAKKAPAGKKAPARPANEDLARIEKIRLRLADWEKAPRPSLFTASTSRGSSHPMPSPTRPPPPISGYVSPASPTRRPSAGSPPLSRAGNDTKDRGFSFSELPTPSTSRGKNNIASSPNQRAWDMKPFSFGTPATAGSKASSPACRPISAWRP